MNYDNTYFTLLPLKCVPTNMVGVYTEISIKPITIEIQQILYLGK